MSRFPTAGHLLSWAGLCPRNDESAGKRRSTRLRKGDPWLKNVPGPPSARKAATSMPSSTVSPADVDQRWQPARSQRRCSPRSTICSRTAPNSPISVPIISIAAQRTSGPNALSSSSQSLASTPGSRPLPKLLEIDADAAPKKHHAASHRARGTAGTRRRGPPLTSPSFFGVPHRPTADPRCMKLCYRACASSA
jgi:Transposase IS116/IS110/IS902 family